MLRALNRLIAGLRGLYYRRHRHRERVANDLSPTRGRNMRVKTRGVVAALKAGLTAVAFIAASTVAPAAATGQPRSPDQRPTVAVMPNFDNGSVLNHADYDALGKGIADVLITELSANSAIRVVERDRIQQLIDEQNLSTSGRVDKATAVQVGKLLGVHHMIFGGFIIDPKGQMRLDARAVNVETSEIEHV